MINNLSVRITDIIRDNVKDIDNNKYEIIQYGIYVFISDILKTVVLLTISYFLGILGMALVSIACNSVLRNFAGGVHAKTQVGCLIWSILITFTSVYSSKYFAFLNPTIVSSILYIICLITIWIYAPSDNENKPVVSKKQRRFLKNASVTVITAIYAVSALLLAQPYSNLVMFSALLEVLTLLPVAYKLTGNKYGKEGYYENC